MGKSCSFFNFDNDVSWLQGRPMLSDDNWFFVRFEKTQAVGRGEKRKVLLAKGYRILLNSIQLASRV